MKSNNPKPIDKMFLNIMRKIWGSPLRFFGFLSCLFLLYFSALYFLDSFPTRFGITSLCFLVLVILLYVIAKRVNDIRNKNAVYLLFGSPVKIIAFLAICFGFINVFYQVLWIYLAVQSILIPVVVGVSLYLIDNALKTRHGYTRKYIAFQFLITICLIATLYLIGKKADATTTFVFPEGTQEEAIIVFGVEGYPALPSSFLWEKTVQIPVNGLLVTSSLIEDLPGHKVNYVNEKNEPLQMNRLYSKDVCHDINALVVAYYFTPTSYYPYIPFEQSDLQFDYQSLYDSICSGQLKSIYVDTRDEYYINEKPRDELYLEFKQNTRD